MWTCLLLLILSKTSAFLYPIADPKSVYNYTAPEDQVSFYLFHRADPAFGEELTIDDGDSIRKSRFDGELDTKVLIHGWTHGKNVPWVVEMRNAMAETGKWNIIVVDWAPLSHVIYIEARLHTPVVAKQLCHLLLTLKRYTGLPLKRVHLIGHSMGAQIAAYTSLKVQLATNEMVGRITGLDPAAPLYEWPHVEYLDEVLDPSDAIFVDVIHTNGRHLGMITPAGHVDYYPNGGEHQPGCGFWICSHIRSVEYWTASIKNPELFKAYLYETWDQYVQGVKNLTKYPMGILSNRFMPHGTYFLEVGDEFKKYVNSVTTIDDSFQ